MSKSSPPPELVEAYTLLKMGQRIEAGNLLRRYLAKNAQDANAWWLLSHTVGKPEQIKKCLEAVLKIDPQHAKARAKLAEIEAAEAPDPAPPPAPQNAPDAISDQASLDEPLPWQQQPVATTHDPFASASADAIFGAPQNTAPAWQPPEVNDPFAGDSAPAQPGTVPADDETSNGSSLLDEEPDDSLFFGTLNAPADKRDSKRKSQSKVVQPLDTAPDAAKSKPRPTVQTAPPPPPPPPPASPELSAEMLAAAFAMPESSDPATHDEAPAGPSFSEFVATATIGRDPFSGEPVNDPFVDIAIGDDPFAEQAAIDLGSPAADRRPTATNDRTANDQFLALVVGIFSVFVLISFVLFALNEGGTISLNIFSESSSTPDMAMLKTGTFAIDYPGEWNQRCATESLGYQVCGIANHALYNEVDWFAAQEIDIGAMLSAAFASPFGADIPDEQISIIVMDVPTSSYAYDDSSWAKTQYEYYQQGWFWDTGATVEYNGREDIVIDGYTAYYYKYTSEGRWREAAWDIYIPHDGIVFWMRATFSGERGDRIPQHIIDEMIESIDINPVTNPA